MGVETEQQLYGFPTLRARWGVSIDTLVRAANRDEIRTIYLCGRRMVPLSEVQRIEREGLGNGRRNRAKKASK